MPSLCLLFMCSVRMSKASTSSMHRLARCQSPLKNRSSSAFLCRLCNASSVISTRNRPSAAVPEEEEEEEREEEEGREEEEEEEREEEEEISASQSAERASGRAS